MKLKVVLLFIIVLAGFLRLWDLGKMPPSLAWDEVSIGYNAYSILKTGRDEHGKYLPLDAFVAYGDYKPPFSIYATIPAIVLLGLNEVSVRLPSAMFGIASVVVMYFLVRELLQFSSNSSIKTNTSIHCFVPVFSALALAISPWHINLSRAGFEANIALYFVLLGIYAILSSVRRRTRWLWSFLPFVFAIYTFNSARYVVVFLSIGLAVFIRKHIRSNLKWIITGLVIALFALGPIFPHLVSKDAWLRYKEVNIFSDPKIVEIANERIASAGNTWWAKIVYNRRIGYARSYLLHFFDHFEPRYLFIKGDGNPKFSIQDVGQLYLADIPFIAIGLVSVFVFSPALGVFLLFWMLVAIIPAASARETPHALRTLNSLPVWIIFISFGLEAILSKCRILKMQSLSSTIQRLLFLVPVFIIVCVYFMNVMYYLHSYYRHYVVEFAPEWQYGYREAILDAQKKSEAYSSISITDSIGRPYMYTLFYLQYPPDKYLKEKQSYFDDAGFYHVLSFDKYRFPMGTMKEDDKNGLYVVPFQEISKGKHRVSIIKYPNGNPALVLYDLK